MAQIILLRDKSMKMKKSLFFSMLMAMTVSIYAALPLRDRTALVEEFKNSQTTDARRNQIIDILQQNGATKNIDILKKSNPDFFARPAAPVVGVAVPAARGPEAPHHVDPAKIARFRMLADEAAKSRSGVPSAPATGGRYVRFRSPSSTTESLATEIPRIPSSDLPHRHVERPYKPGFTRLVRYSSERKEKPFNLSPTPRGGIVPVAERPTGILAKVQELENLIVERGNLILELELKNQRNKQVIAHLEAENRQLRLKLEEIIQINEKIRTQERKLELYSQQARRVENSDDEDLDDEALLERKQRRKAASPIDSSMSPSPLLSTSREFSADPYASAQTIGLGEEYEEHLKKETEPSRFSN